MAENTGITSLKGDATAPRGKGVKVMVEPLIPGRLARCGIPVTVYDH